MAELVVIGGGPAGMAAALAAYKEGIDDILLLERDSSTGGVLNQCIHNGFGLHKFKKELTGPEYAAIYERELKNTKIKIKLNATVTDLDADCTVTYISPDEGIKKVKPKAVILAMGCRERPKGALNIPGTRPAGIMSAGTAQRLINIEGFMPGKEVVILGSGDIGLIMARRMTLEGAKVKAVCEIMPESKGLRRNVVQCLYDFGIPLLLSTTVVEIHGRDRLCGVTVERTDKTGRQYIPCDTLLISVGLICENELSKKAGILLNSTGGLTVTENKETSVPGIFACGNVVKVHELADFVSDEAEIAGRAAAAYIKGERK